MKNNLVVSLIILLTLRGTMGSYEFIVTLHSLENRGGRCADEQFCNGGEGCCESSTCATTACEYILEYCQRLPPKALSYQRSVDFAACASEARIRNSGPIIRFERNQTNFGSENPIRFTSKTLMYDVVQIHFELRHNNTVLIDRFLLEVPSAPEEYIPSFYLNGIFGFARMNISVVLRCIDNHCGLMCERKSGCDTCEAGYTGTYCSEIIRSCENSTCNITNVMCIDKVLDYECVCKPGFTGEDCLTDINECTGGEEVCSFQGRCVNTEGSFFCECNEEYTGEFCETRLPRYAVDIKFYSFNNPGGKCADLSGTCAGGTGCCDTRDCSDSRCNYMFLYCLRPSGSVVSLLRSENRGNCVNNINETNSRLILVGDDFLSNIYGTPNPLKYTLEQSPHSRLEFYLEILDDDRNKREDENNELVDRFVIPLNTSLSNKIYVGVFGLASVNISVSVHCSEFYFGDECNKRRPDIMTTSAMTYEPSVSMTSNVTIPVIAAVLSAVVLAAILLNVILCIVCYQLHKKKQSVITNESFELQASPHTTRSDVNTIQSQRSHNSSNIQTIRERLESLPNTYNELRNNHSRDKNDSLQQSTGFCSPFPNEVNLSSNYEEIDTSLLDSMGSSRPAQTTEVASEPQVYTFTRKTEDRCDDDTYDYDAPYWDPSNEERGLLSQLEKLRIPSARTSDIKELEVIGSGAFGTVVKATWNQKENPKDGQEFVAVKKIEGGVSEEERIIFLKEAVIMGQFNHPNIVKILGIVANGDEGQYQIIMEYMPKGNLRQYLHSLDKSADVLPSQLLAFSRQIASAMSYLSMKGYVHRDLAARNILICDNSTCKIADFGLSRDICTESFYLAHGGKIPVKWAAPESINYRLWSTASDVWSYGCVLYEIWSLEYKPFHNCNNSEVLNKLSSGYRLPPPVGCPRAIYQLMINCWHRDSDSRPSFCQILSYLNEPEYKITGWSQNDKDQYSEESRRIGGNLEDGSKLYIELQNTYKKT